MKAKRKERQSAEIDVGAFSDIAFLLIIFFVLTTTFVKPFGHKLDIPSGSSDKSRKEEKQLTINLRPGQISYGEKGQSLTVDQLRQRLLAQDFKSKKPEKRMVIVECSQDLPYDEYFPVAMAVTESGGVIAMLDDEEGGKK